MAIYFFPSTKRIRDVELDEFDNSKVVLTRRRRALGSDHCHFRKDRRPLSIEIRVAPIGPFRYTHRAAPCGCKTCPPPGPRPDRWRPGILQARSSSVRRHKACWLWTKRPFSHPPMDYPGFDTGYFARSLNLQGPNFSGEGVAVKLKYVKMAKYHSVCRAVLPRALGARQPVNRLSLKSHGSARGKRKGSKVRSLITVRRKVRCLDFGFCFEFEMGNAQDNGARDWDLEGRRAR